MLLASLVLISMTFAPTTYAAQGFFIGGQVGGFFVNPDAATAINNTSFFNSGNTGGFGLNLNLGYKFSPYLGLEADYSNYSTGTILFLGLLGNPTFYNMVGIMGDLTLPFYTNPATGYSFGFLGKVGGTYVHASNLVYVPNSDIGVYTTPPANYFRPQFYAGLSFTFGNSMDLDFGYTYLLGQGTPPQTNSELGSPYLPDLNFISIGLTYYFGHQNRYYQDANYSENGYY